MRLVLDSVQEQLRSSVRDVLTDHAQPARVREVMGRADGEDRELWHLLAGQLGLAGLVVPERYGGAGAGHVERCVVLEELGRTLAPVPFFASAVLAVDTVLALGDAELAGELLPRLSSGELIGALAVAADDGPWGSSAASVAATTRDGEWMLDGHASFVVSGEAADRILVYAGTPQGPGWFVVPRNESGLHRSALRTLDPTRRLTRLEFTGTPARGVPTAEPVAVLESVRDLAAVALAAEQVGVMAHVLESTVDYAKVRVQFGRPIGSYQAVKHACADMYCAYEQAVSVLRYAAWVADHDPGELPVAAAMSQVFTGPASFQTAADGLQLHGGLGYTWEHEAHLYYKRAKTGELLLASPQQARVLLADALGH